MQARSWIFSAAALAILTGCQSSGNSGGGTGGGEPAVAAGGKEGTCVAEAAKLFSTVVGDVATSAEYPQGDGSAIEGSVNKGGDIRLFRCDFDAAGGFVKIEPIVRT